MTGKLTAAIEEPKIFHEAVAYVNRLGQFYYFVRSNFITRALGDGLAQIPSISRYVIFRHKHAAHRSIDAPRKETEDTQMLQAMSLSSTWGRFMTLKPGSPQLRWPRTMKAESPLALEFHRQEWLNNYVTFQLYDADTDTFVNLTIELEHEKICEEAYNVLRSAIMWGPAPIAGG